MIFYIMANLCPNYISNFKIAYIIIRIVVINILVSVHGYGNRAIIQAKVYQQK